MEVGVFLTAPSYLLIILQPFDTLRGKLGTYDSNNFHANVSNLSPFHVKGGALGAPATTSQNRSVMMKTRFDNATLLKKLTFSPLSGILTFSSRRHCQQSWPKE